MPSSKTQHLTIELRHLRTGYTERRRSVVISPDLSLSIRPGEIVMLMGPNGSGKSTLMHTMAGLLPPLAGEVQLGEKPLSSLTMKEVARQLSLVLTERIPAGNMDVWEVVTIGRYPYTGFRGVLSTEDKRICEEALATCRLTELRERIFDTLSDGEKQRVMIARALAQETPLILLDEPTAHLDLPSRLEVTTMLRTLAHKLGKSILISTHELDLALGWADTIWLLDRSGAIIAKAPEDLILDGDIERVFGDPRLRFDSERGEFSIAEEPGQQIHLTGEGLRYSWTCRALHRLGYGIISGDLPPETSSITISEAGWTLRTPMGITTQHHSITALLSALGERSASVY